MKVGKKKKRSVTPKTSFQKNTKTQKRKTKKQKKAENFMLIQKKTV